MNEWTDITALTAADLPVRFGRYELLGILGSGGVGRVFDARLIGPSGFQKAVALKVLRTEVSARSVEAAVDLAEEARVGALLSHPNIVDVFELEMTAGQVCVAMQRVEGRTASQLLRVHRPLPLRAALDLMAQACSGLAHAHRLQVGGGYRWVGVQPGWCIGT